MRSLRRPAAGWAVLPFFLLPGAGWAFDNPGSQADNLRDGEGVEAVRENCLYCHDDSYIVSLRLPREEWESVLEVMVGMGMPPLEGEVLDAVLGYLSTVQGTDAGGAGDGDRVSANAGGEARDLPDLPWAEPRYRPNPLNWHRPRG